LGEYRAFGLRQQGVFHSVLPVFHPAGRKTGNIRMVSVALLQAGVDAASAVASGDSACSSATGGIAVAKLPNPQ
jgi:hypothetical protein